MNPRQTLKKLLQREKLLVAPGCFDGLSARLVEEAGFEAAYLSGGAVARSMGIPDIGLVTMSESIERAIQVVSTIKIPIIADADTGYGNAVNLVRSVREFERAGVAAIHIEDQITPKRCGHLDGKEVIPRGEMEMKLEAALKTRTDPDFCIIARTDARGVNGFDDAIERARAFAKLGVDAIFVEAPQSEEELAEIPRRIPDVPLLVNVFKGGKTPDAAHAAPRTNGLPDRNLSFGDATRGDSRHAHNACHAQTRRHDRIDRCNAHDFQRARPRRRPG